MNSVENISCRNLESNMNFKNNNLGNEPPGDGGGGGFTRPGLTRQGSIYSLTFDEFQSSLGKEFGSMNMDELLKNIWSAEETQAMASGMVPVGGGQEGLQLPRQGSLTLPRTLSQKTVDQVWKDLSKDGNSGGGTNLSQVQAQAQAQTQRQQTLGEVTLEEFLVRAGVVREEAQIAAKSQIADNNKAVFFGNDAIANTSFSVGFQQPSPRPVAGLMGNLGAENTNHLQVQGSSLPLNVNGVRSTYQRPQQQQPIMPKQPGFGYGPQTSQLNSPGIRGGGVMGLGDQSLTNNMGLVQSASAAIPGALGVGAVSPVTPLSSEGIGKSNGDSSSLSPSPYMFNGGIRGRKSGTVEKVVERRQRRMIKNRESAARSRARKQAYTVELEAEVAKLKEENDKLQRKQEKIMEMQKNQEMEMRNLLQGGPKKRLRKTESGPW